MFWIVSRTFMLKLHKYSHVSFYTHSEISEKDLYLGITG